MIIMMRLDIRSHTLTMYHLVPFKIKPVYCLHYLQMPVLLNIMISAAFARLQIPVLQPLNS